MSVDRFGDLVAGTLARPCEPVASTRDRSVREMAKGPHHIAHRFPFHGSIRVADVVAKQMAECNPLLALSTVQRGGIPGQQVRDKLLSWDEMNKHGNEPF